MRHAKRKTGNTPYVMHPEELGHGKDHARIPREDSEGHEDHVKENTGHDKHSQLRIPLGSATGVSSTWTPIRKTHLHR
jgi:hypothetical protein